MMNPPGTPLRNTPRPRAFLPSPLTVVRRNEPSTPRPFNLDSSTGSPANKSSSESPSSLASIPVTPTNTFPECLSPEQAISSSSESEKSRMSETLPRFRPNYDRFYSEREFPPTPDHTGNSYNIVDPVEFAIRSEQLRKLANLEEIKCTPAKSRKTDETD